MSEWIDVPVADVQTGDEVKVDGFGKSPSGSAVGYVGCGLYDVASLLPDSGVVIHDCGLRITIRRSSIVAVRRRKPEPSPKPGDWRHNSTNCGRGLQGRPCVDQNECCYAEVFRASGGWSRDTRTGQPWVMKEFGQASATVPIVMGSICYSLRKLADDISQGPPIAKGEPLADYYRRIGLDVRPADRRGKR